MMTYKKIWLLLYIFCFLFAPPFVTKINLLIPISIYSLIIIIFKYPKKLKSFFKNKDIVKILSVIFVYFYLYILTCLLNSISSNDIFPKNYILNIYSFVLNFPCTIICAIYLIFKFEDEKLGFNDMVRYFIFAGLIQSLLAIISLISPSIRQIMLDHMLNENTRKFLDSPWVVSRRFYGFANNMLDLFGFGTGIIAILPLYYAKVNKKYKYLLLIPVLLLVPLLNSRTGLLIALIGIVVYMISIFLLRKLNLSKIFKYSFILIFLVFFAISAVKVFSPNTLDWIINDFSSFFSSNTTYGTADILFDKSWWQLPEAKNLFFGTGYSITGYSNFASTLSVKSDVGYINEIWRTGFIGLSIIIYLLFYMNYLAKKNCSNKIYKFLFNFFVISSLVMMIKGYVFSYNPGNVIIYTLIFMTIYVNSNSKNRSDFNVR